MTKRIGTRSPAAIGLSLLFLGAGPNPFTGTWTRGDPEKGGGRIVTSETGGEVRFDLEAWRGAPSYNSGTLSGQFSVSKGRGTFRSPGSTAACELGFVFEGATLQVQSLNDANDCGFGHGVSANGRYRRTSGKMPAFTDSEATPPSALDDFLGTWRGSSTCTDLVAAPACRDEAVVYDVRPSEKAGAAELAADKIVDGQRIPMGELEFAYDKGEECWRSEFETPRAHGVWCLVIKGKEMTGTLRLVPAGSIVRRVQLRRD